MVAVPVGGVVGVGIVGHFMGWWKGIYNWITGFKPTGGGGGSGIKPIKKPKGKSVAPQNVQAYIQKYVLDYPDVVAPLDIKDLTTANQNQAIIADKTCEDLFGTNIEPLKINAQGEEGFAREYFAGQVLRALNFATPRFCAYIDDANLFKSFYLTINRDQFTSIDKVKSAGASVYSPQLNFLKLSKWIVGETDYANDDYKYLVQGQLALPFAFDFEHASSETNALVFDSNYIKQGEVEEVSIQAFINQLEALEAGDDESVLHYIFYNPRVEKEDGEFKKLRTNMYKNIKKQINALLEKLQTLHSDYKTASVDAEIQKQRQALTQGQNRIEAVPADPYTYFDYNTKNSKTFYIARTKKNEDFEKIVIDYLKTELQGFTLIDDLSKDADEVAKEAIKQNASYILVGLGRDSGDFQTFANGVVGTYQGSGKLALPKYDVAIGKYFGFAKAIEYITCHKVNGKTLSKLNIARGIAETDVKLEGDGSLSGEGKGNLDILIAHIRKYHK